MAETRTIQPRRTAIVPRSHRLVFCSLLVLITFYAYWPVRHFGFVNYDDNQYIYLNPRIHAGLTASNIQWAFTTFATSNYHPLTWISYFLDASVFDAQPQGMHVENVIWHALNAMLLYLLLLRATGLSWPSLLAALLWAAHPTHVESVAWISERKDLLSLFFLLLAMLAYLRCTATDCGRTRLMYLLTLVLFACGLLCKSMLVTFPFLLLLLDFWPLDRFAHLSPDSNAPRRFKSQSLVRAINEKIPFFILSLIASVLTYRAQSTIAASLRSIPLSLRAQNAALSYTGYLTETVWPVNLSVLYPYRWQIPIVALSGALMVLGSITAFIFLAARQRRYAIVGWLWFLGTLVPVIGLIQVGAQSMSDRYLYLPSIGLNILVVWGLRELVGRRIGEILFPILATAVTAALVLLTRVQVGYWSDSHHLFSHASVVLNGRAGEEVRLGVLAAQQGDNHSAEQHYRLALQADPNNYSAEFNLGNLLLAKNPALSIQLYAAAALNQPQLAEVQVNWGVALMEMNSPAAAFSHFQRAESLDPDSYDAHYNLGRLFAIAGKQSQARAEFSRALACRPDDAKAIAAIRQIDSSANQLGE